MDALGVVSRIQGVIVEVLGGVYAYPGENHAPARGSIAYPGNRSGESTRTQGYLTTPWIRRSTRGARGSTVYPGER